MTISMVMIGCGNMGQAMLARWLAVDALQGITLYVVKPTSLSAHMQHPAVISLSSLAELPPSLAPAMVWLAIKPQKMAEIVPQLPQYFPRDTLYCTLAAGVKIARYHEWLGVAAPLVRLMPNTPVAIGQGVVSMVTHDVDDAQAQLLDALLAPLGLIAPLQSEELMDVATAVAGSGTAYVYLLMEALMEAGILHGLPDAFSKEMVVQSFAGAAAMALHYPSQSLEELRAAVTSKGGTTEAALQQLEKNNALRCLMQEAVAAAIARAYAL